MKASHLLLVSTLVLLPQSVTYGAILFGKDNSANQTDPGVGLPWDTVGKITNSTSSNVVGSAVYLGNGWVVTANHVDITNPLPNPNRFVSFDGTSTFQIDLSTVRQVAAGVDLKVMRLTTLPSLTGVTLLTTGIETTDPAYTVGWGVGRAVDGIGNPLQLPGTSLVTWGDNSTAAKRWGTNRPSDIVNVGYEAIRTIAGGNDGAGTIYNPDGTGNDEAAITVNDSGSALFQLIGGTWYLIGIATAVEMNGQTFFGNDTPGTTASGFGHDNYFARVSAYDTQIITAVPEPGVAALLALSAPLFLLRRCRRTSRHS